jgi:twitching motility two-component system response regulator PilG
MNQAKPIPSPQQGSRRFILEMIGFSDAEKNMLASTFRLTGRRDFCYVARTDDGPRNDIYLINSDNAEALKSMREHAPNVHSPAVIIGREAVSLGWPFVQKPIHWMRLFEQLDAVMQTAILAREKRVQDAGSQWDGLTYRRVVDEIAGVEEILVQPVLNESVLVVDDSATVRAFMRIKLAPFHFDVDFAENGEQAVALALSKNYTCIFLDIMMPGIDGYEVCKRIKSSSSLNQPAVVMLTSKSSLFDKFRANWAGCDAYLGKPVPENDLLATIARFLPSARA